MGGFIAVIVLLLAGIGGSLFFRSGIRNLEARIAAVEAEGPAGDRFNRRAEKLSDLREQRSLGVIIRLVARGVIALGVILLIVFSITIVPTRNIGVSIALGKPTGTLGNGPHLIAPWESVVNYDATIQTLDMSGDGSDGKPAMDVRIANAATATMHVTVQWQIDPNSDITQLHLDWREFDALQDKVIKPRLAAALNKVFETYDPLIALKQSGGRPERLSDMEGRVQEELQASLPPGMMVRTLKLPFVEYPAQVQKVLSDYQLELGATQVAIQQQQTAAAQKAAIEILASAKMTPEAFAQQCLVVTERLAQASKGLPPAWSCVAGGAQSVVPVR